MCLILLALNAHPDYPLVLAANRDEFYRRPSAGLHRWHDAPILAGRDEQAGGTWLGVTPNGRFAALTNVREGGRAASGRRSRGELVREFLAGGMSAEDYLAAIEPQAYDGFNLLLGKLYPAPDLLWFSNREPGPQRLESGVLGLSNARLDTPWPKLASGRAALTELLSIGPDIEAALALLADDTQAEDAELPATGVPYAWEKALSSRFIRTPDYGTRSSSVLILDKDGTLSFHERRFAPDGERLNIADTRLTLSLAGA